MKIIALILNRTLGLSLPSGDDLAPRATSYTIFPRVGSSISRSFYQRELMDAHQSGKWIPKILLLPDVGKFEIELQSYDPVLLAQGILSRYPSSVTLYKNRNRKMNRYLVYSYWRLYKSLNNPTKFWSIAVNLIRNSCTLLAVAMHSVDKNIYRELPMHELRRLIKRINLMRANFHFKETLWMESGNPIQAMRHYVRYFRVYIPKGSNSHRPLGVPTRAWRIYQKMWMIPIMGFTGHLIPSNFHGYIPQRGTGTAWQEILRTVLHKANIFEVDFRQFFPSVPTAELTYALYTEGVIPLSVCVYLHYMNNSLPTYLIEDKLPETHYTEGSESSLVLDQLKLKLSKPVNKEIPLPGISTTGLREPTSTLMSNSLDPTLNRPYSFKSPRLVQGLQPSTMPDTRKTGASLKSELLRSLPYYNDISYAPVQFDLNFEMLKWRGSKGIPLNKPLTEAQREEQSQYLNLHAISSSSKYAQLLLGSKVKFGTGLPQGATLSPYLSILYLEIVLTRLGKPKDVDYLFYADDGIFYSDNYNSLTQWIRTLSGPRQLPTSLSHYNINIHPEKSRYIKLHGTWSAPLKFLGIKFIPGPTLATSRLVADTRDKIILKPDFTLATKPGSKLEFDKALLVFYTYSKELILKNQDFISRRLATVKTPAMKYYYKSLNSLIGVNGYMIDYMYLLGAVIAAGVESMYLFLNSNAYLLASRATLVRLLPTFTSSTLAREEIEVSSLLEDSDKIFSAISWLKGGYQASYHQPSTTERLIKRLEVGVTSISLESLPLVVQPTNSVDESLRNLLSAVYFHNIPEEISNFTILRNITQVIGQTILRIYDTYLKRYVERVYPLTRTILTIVPLDLYRFYYSLLAPSFGIFYPFNETTPVTKKDKSTNSLNYQLKKNWHVIKSYLMTNQFRNLANSEYFGLIQSRLYSGSWIPEDYMQSFKYTFKPNSLAQFLQDRDTSNSLNVFVGSSYAFHEVVRLSSYLKRSPRTQGPFILFKEGYLQPGDWAKTPTIELETPSLSQEFPGGQEPNWNEKPS